MGAWLAECVCCGAFGAVPPIVAAIPPLGDPTKLTWFHLSAAAVVVALYFNFRRPIALRNWDVVALFAMMPGLLLVTTQAKSGYILLFAAAGYWVGRCLLDVTLDKRPEFQCNLTGGGLAFLLVASLGYYTAVVFTRPLDPTSRAAVHGAKSLLQVKRMPYRDADGQVLLGPAYYWLYVPAVAICDELVEPEVPPLVSSTTYSNPLAARVMLVVAHALIVGGLLLVGLKHLGGIQNGLALAVLYLLVPYTLHAAHQSLHVWPAALVVWAVVLAGAPVGAALVLALGGAMALFPIFLVPAWASYYRTRGRTVFLATFLVAYLGLVACAWIGGGGTDVLWRSTFGILEGPGKSAWDLAHASSTDSFWHHVDVSPLRIPLLIAYLALCAVLAIWPADKSLGRLVALSAVVILGCQFWIGHTGGQYVLWSLPLLLMLCLRAALPGKKASG